MFDETNALSRRLSKIELEIKALKKATDTLIADSEKTMSAAMPQDYQAGPDGGVSAVPNTGAPLITAHQMSAPKDQELQKSVYDPLSAWQTEHSRMKHRLSEVDKASLLLDEARRKHYKGAQKELKENVMKQDNVSATRTQEVDNPHLTNARAAYTKIEAEVHEELWRHAQNARQIQQYITAAMQLQGERLLEASRVHAQPLSGGMSGGAGNMGGGVGAATGPTGQMHQPTGGAMQGTPAMATGSAPAAQI